MAPVGAYALLKGSIPASVVGTPLFDCMTLLSWNDALGRGGSFIQGLQPDLSDLVVTLSDESTEVEWYPVWETFDQTPGSENLDIWVNIGSISSATDTTIVAFRGCSSGGPSAKSSVVSADTRLFLPLNDLTFEDWTGVHNFYDPGGGATIAADGAVGKFMECNSAGGAAHDNFEADASGDGTIIMWYKWATHDYQRVMSRGDWSRHPAITYHSNGFLYLGVGGYWYAGPGWTPTLGQWYQLAIVCEGDAARAKLYIDGSEYLGSPSGAYLYKKATTTIFGGHTWGGYTDHPTGSVDNVLWIDRPLTMDELVSRHTMVSDGSSWFTLNGTEETLEYPTSHICRRTRARRDMYVPGVI